MPDNQKEEWSYIVELVSSGSTIPVSVLTRTFGTQDYSGIVETVKDHWGEPE